MGGGEGEKAKGGRGRKEVDLRMTYLLTRLFHLVHIMYMIISLWYEE